MDWVTALFALTPTILLLAQGTSCLRRPNAPLYVRRFGFLCSVLSGLSFILCLLLASGTLVLSAEFGLVMVQGSLARFGIAILLIGSALGAGMGLSVCGLEAGRRTHLLWLLGSGLGVSFLATARLLPLNTGDGESFRIYAYDLWWPPLLIYLSACLVESALSILRLHHRPIRLWVATAFIAGLALLALSQPQFGDPTSAVLWQSYLLLLLPASISVVTWLFFRIPRQRLTRMQRWLRRGLTVLPAVIGLLSGVYWAWGTPLSPMLTSWPSLLWLSWPLLVGLITPHQLYRAWRAGRIDWQALPRRTFQQSVLLVAIAVLALSLAALVSFVSINRTLALAGFVFAWILLAEAIAGGPLRAVFELLISRELWPAVRTRSTVVSAYLGSGLRDLLSLSSWPAVVVKTLAGVCVLIAVSELPNAGKTLIQPLKVSALPGRNEFGQSASERNELGQFFSERVVNTLSLLHKDLRKEIILFLQPDVEEVQGEVSFALVSASESMNPSATALGKSEDLEFGPVKIPLGLLVAPIQGPMRWLLDVHLIDGSIQAEQHGHSLLARSTTGETWKVTLPLTDPSQPVTPILPDIIASLSSEFAFKIITTDPTFAPTMTKSWEAFKSFKAGLKHWQEFEAKQDYQALNRTIEQFREATSKDPGFAFAYYRLGLALQKDGQPGAAAKAFRASLKADSTFAPAHIALASLLYDFEPHDLTASALPAASELNIAAHRAQINEARKLWQQIIHFPAWAVSVPNRASAYYGLCRQASRHARSSNNIEREHYLAYYYCKQAAALYASLSTAKRAKPAIKTGEASVLHTLGATLGRFQRHHFTGQSPEWNCWRSVLRQSPYSRDSLSYFKRALALLPDDYRIRCSAARAAYVLGDPEPMQRLRADPGAHVSLANGHRKLAKDRMMNGHSAVGARSYLLALNEYQEAIDLDPTHIEALTGYAMTFGEWRMQLSTSTDPDGPGLAIAQRAEAYARQGVALVTDKLDPVTEAMVRYALGKVLFAQARPTEAVKELETAVSLAASHSTAYEIRRELAQACLCAASTNRRGAPEESVQALEARAVGLLMKIRGRGLTRESRLNGAHARATGSSRVMSVCDAEFPIEGMPDPAAAF